MLLNYLATLLLHLSSAVVESFSVDDSFFFVVVVVVVQNWL